MDKGYSHSEWVPKIKRGEDSRRLVWVCKECGFMGRSRTRHCGGCGRKMEKHESRGDGRVRDILRTCIDEMRKEER